MIRLRNEDPEGPTTWWARNIMRIQRENPNYCAEKYAVFRTQRCRDGEQEEILQIPHPTRGYMVQDVCKRCLQHHGRGSMRRGREDSDDDDDEDEPEPAFANRRQRALPAAETGIDRAFVQQAQAAMHREEDPRAALRAARLAAIERRVAQPAAAPAQAPPHPPVGVNARALIAQARLEALQRRQAAPVPAPAPAPAPAPVIPVIEQARRRSLLEQREARRDRARRQLSGREERLSSKYKKTRFGGMVMFSNNQKAPKATVTTKKNKKSKKKKNH